MRWRTALSTTAAVGLISMGIALPAHGALTTYCQGTAADVTVPGDLVIRADQACDLSGVTVTGNVTVRAGADLIAEGSTFEGSLRVQEDAYLDSKGSTIAGSLVLRSAYGAYVEDGAVDGRTDAQESGFLYSLGSEHSAWVVAASGETYLDGSVVRGSVTTTDEHLTDVYDSWITGDLSVTGAAEGGLLCTSEVDGDLSYTGNAGLVQIGADAPVGPCGVSYVGGDVALTDNTDDVVISNAIIRGDLRCEGNDPAPTGEDNRVRGAAEGQCAELAASADASGRSRIAPQQVDDRRDGVLEKVGARTAEGEREAAAAGSAGIGD